MRLLLHLQADAGFASQPRATVIAARPLRITGIRGTHITYYGPGPGTSEHRRPLHPSPISPACATVTEANPVRSRRSDTVPPTDRTAAASGTPASAAGAPLTTAPGGRPGRAGPGPAARRRGITGHHTVDGTMRHRRRCRI
eukprot:282323-Hanusia_phi.AAC.2